MGLVFSVLVAGYYTPPLVAKDVGKVQQHEAVQAVSVSSLAVTFAISNCDMPGEVMIAENTGSMQKGQYVSAVEIQNTSTAVSSFAIRQRVPEPYSFWEWENINNALIHIDPGLN